MAASAAEHALERKIIDPADETPENYALVIRASHRRTLEQIVATGRWLIRAKARLKGTFCHMFPEDAHAVARPVPFARRTAECFMAIASYSRFIGANAQSIAHGHPVTPNVPSAVSATLPATWAVLYQLQRLPEPRFDEALRLGKITPTMTVAAARALVSRSPKVKRAVRVPFPPWQRRLERMVRHTLRTVAAAQIQAVITPILAEGKETST